jgi:DNA adenine methylase
MDEMISRNGLGLKPPLKWAGGKRWQITHIRPLWKPNAHRRLVEPFCGGLAVALNLFPKYTLLNDINTHLINFYRWLKKGLHITIPMMMDKELYYRHRERFNHLLATGRANSKEAASLFYYLNRTGFNGLCRFNQRGKFNVPFGRYATINYQFDFSGYCQVFSSWEFTNVDFEEIPLKPTDFIYADPPYDVEFTQYAKQGFGWEEQERTAKWLARHPGPVVLSNQATSRIKRLYKSLGYSLKYLKAPRRISCNGDRTPAKEVLAIRNI